MKNRNTPIEGASCADPAAAGRWHIVHTKPGVERVAAKVLMEADFVVHYPHYQRSIRHAGQRTLALVPLYPRYLFVAVQPGQPLAAINSAPGVSTVVYRGQDPIEVPVPVMQSEVQRTDINGRVTTAELRRLGLVRPSKHGHRFVVGQKVQFARGPFEGFCGIVASLDKSDGLRIWLGLFGRTDSVPVQAVEADLVGGAR